jgi:hypothetical protein
MNKTFFTILPLFNLGVFPLLPPFDQGSKSATATTGDIVGLL